jgi:hypothetical protein
MDGIAHPPWPLAYSQIWFYGSASDHAITKTLVGQPLSFMQQNQSCARVLEYDRAHYSLPPIYPIGKD